MSGIGSALQKGWDFVKQNAFGNPNDPGHTGFIGGAQNIITGNKTFDRQVAMNAIQQKYQRQNMAYQNRYQTHMSNTEVQRRVKDMQKAGINPALAVGGGGDFQASSPNSSTAYAAGNYNNQARTDGFSNSYNAYERWLQGGSSYHQDEDSWQAGARYGRSAERAISADELIALAGA